MSLKELQDRMAKELYGITPDEAKATGSCVQCGEPALENCYSEEGRKEYSISGLCEKCFDSVTEEEEEEEE